MDVQEVRSVLVTNISPNANEKTVSDFFSFCGKISKLFLKKEEGKDTSSAVIQFETESAAKTALLLTNALIVDRPITVTSTVNINQSSSDEATSEVHGTPVDTKNITHKDFGGVPDEQRSKTSVVASLLAAGYVLTENALDKAKEYDEKTNFSAKAKETVDQLKVKAHEIDVQYGISDKATAVQKTITDTAKKIDAELGLSDKASIAANVIKSGVQSGYQMATENPTIQKGVEAVKSTAQKVSNSATQTFNEVKKETNEKIEEKEKQQNTTTASTYGVTTPPSTVAMDTTTTTTTTAEQEPVGGTTTPF